jgi:sulfate adenylyltransferase subunit 2
MAHGDDRLYSLENESIYIIREAFARLTPLGMLWSIGKDSTVLLWLTKKAFFGSVPFPLVHIDTTYKIPSMITYRDQLVKDWGLQLIVGSNRSAIAEGKTFPAGALSRVECCTALKTRALQQVIEHHHFKGLFVGLRKDEEPTRAKERVFSPRGSHMTWNVEEQPPEFWDHFRTDCPQGAHIRVHPLLQWTELDIWRYIEREHIPVSPLYFAGPDGRRYRSLGCLPCTSQITSTAATVSEIVAELRVTVAPERSGRAQDHESEGSFERLRRDGYM